MEWRLAGVCSCWVARRRMLGRNADSGWSTGGMVRPGRGSQGLRTRIAGKPSGAGSRLLRRSARRGGAPVADAVLAPAPGSPAAAPNGWCVHQKVVDVVGYRCFWLARRPAFLGSWSRCSAGWKPTRDHRRSRRGSAWPSSRRSKRVLPTTSGLRGGGDDDRAVARLKLLAVLQREGREACADQPHRQR